LHLGNLVALWHNLSYPQRSLLPNIVLVVALALAGLALAWLPLSLGMALVFGPIIFLIVLVHPTWGLYLLIFAVPFGGLREIQVGPVTIGALEALWGLVLAAWLARMTSQGRIEIPQPPLLWPFLVYLGVGLLSLLVTLSLGYSLKELLKWGEMLALYLFVASNVRREQVGPLVNAILLAGAAQALVGVYQFFFRVGPEGFLLFDGRFMRAYGTFAQPNPYAGYLGLILPLAYSLLIGFRTSEGTEAWERESPLTAPSSRLKREAADKHPALAIWRLAPSAFFYAALFALIAIALLMSWSRGAMVAAATALIVVSVIRSRRAAVLFALALFLVAVTLLLSQLQLLPPIIMQRFLDAVPFLGIPDVRSVEITEANFAVVERLAHWQAAWEMWAEHPWLGVGIGNYVPVYPAYALPYWRDPLGHAHNYYLQVAAETGIIGLAAYLLLWGWSFVVAWRTVRGTVGYQQSIAVGIFGVLVHLSVHNFFDDLYVQGMYLHVALLLALLYIIKNVTRRLAGSGGVR
jgi:putative inorganic carbon (HCO3(-)) transporter